MTTLPFADNHATAQAPTANPSRTPSHLLAAFIIPITLMLVSGCHRHVRLAAPDRTSTGATRITAYKRLRPLSYHQTHITTLRNGVPVSARTVTNYLQLAGGQRVYHPEDLLPVVGPSSPTATAVEDYETLMDWKKGLMGTGGGLAAIGLGIMVASLAGAFDGPPMEDSLGLETRERPLGPLFAGLGVAAAGSLTFSISFLLPADDEKATAFETYDGSLRAELGICETEDELVDCDE